MFDLKITGGTIIDGTGQPGYAGDVAVKDGKIAALGTVVGAAAATIDARGRAVTPGFIDLHTHYDAQIAWDPSLAISSWHGITTVLMGNCGFSVAPTRTEHRDLVLRTLERVEGMSLAALRAGVGPDFPLHDFAAYLDAIERRGTLINIAASVGHTAVRLNAMGEDAVRRRATADEVAAMARLVRAARDAGAYGFTTSLSLGQFAYDGNPIPSRLADFDEIDTLANAFRAGGTGLMQASIGKLEYLDRFNDIAGRRDLTFTWTGILGGLTGPGSHRKYLAEAHATQARGLRVFPQFSPLPLEFEFDFDVPLPFERRPCLAATKALDRAGKIAAYRDPALRRAFKADIPDGIDASLAGWIERTTIVSAPHAPELDERPLAQAAAERGVHPIDLALDLAADSDLKAKFRLAILNFVDDEVAEILKDPCGVVAFSDAGAHASQLCNAHYSTHILQHWVRETGTLALSQAVYMLTGRPADVASFKDRGRLAVGFAADIVVFDPATIAATSLKRVYDLPAGGDRIVCEAPGIEAVIVNGTPIRQAGKDLPMPGRYPGRVLRNT
ncbi:MAG: amidohydrolase family protein [Alphaproteobacteria bacterium]|nr:amidohydrolase family protein [Alphaproteobacteria bacterium]